MRLMEAIVGLNDSVELVHKHPDGAGEGNLAELIKDAHGSPRLKYTTCIKHIRKGIVIREDEYHNVVTNAGKAAVAGLILNDVSVDDFDYIAVGTGTTSELATDTTLETEITTGGGERAAAVGTRVTTAVTNDTAQLAYTFSFTASFAVTESGVLNAASAGDLLCRKTFSAYNVVNGDSLEVTWKVQVA